MINIHILGNGTAIYAARTLLEINQDHFQDEIKVNCFGDFYFAKSMTYALNNHISVTDVVSAADIVICTDPEFEHEDIVAICVEYNKPLFCTFVLENKKTYQNAVILDGLNVENAASDLWINRILDVTENVTEIEHYFGLSKLFETGDRALPGITSEEYRSATQNITGQPKLLWMNNRYFYAQCIFEEVEDNIPVSSSWIIDTDQIDASKVDLQTQFIFHTVIKIKNPDDNQITIRRSHMTCQDSRTISAWFYINTCVLGSFIHMYINNKLPKNCQDYNQIDHSLFSDNIFGSRFRIA